MLDKDKKDKLSVQERKYDTPPAKGSAAPAASTNPAAAGADSPKKVITADAAQKDWDDSNKPQAWSEDPALRAVMVAATRTIAVGAFSSGTFFVRKLMNGYDASKPFLEQTRRNPATFYAKAVDNCLGKPTRWLVEKISRASGMSAEASKIAGLKAVHFRPTSHARTPYEGGQKIWGRTWGEEATMLAGNFYLMSVVNAGLQDIIQSFDPHVKKSYKDEKGHINALDAITSFGKAWWRYLSYNGGEDLFVCAFTYPWALRGIRHCINKISPGFNIISDHGLYGGGGFKLGDNGLHPLGPDGKTNPAYRTHIIGDYRLENAVDLGLRFMTYNGAFGVPGTLHFREVYNHIANRIAGRPSSLIGPATEKEEYKGVIGTVTDGVKWWLRGTVKATIAMFPTVFAFFPTRATQLMHDGIFTHKKYGMITYSSEKDDKRQPFKINYLENLDDAPGSGELGGGLSRKAEAHAKPFYFSQYNGDITAKIPFIPMGPLMVNEKDSYLGHTRERNILNPANLPDPTKEHNIGRTDWEHGYFHPYHQGESWPAQAADWVGRKQYGFTKLMDGVAKKADALPYAESVKRFIGLTKADGPDGVHDFDKLTRAYGRDLLSYVPYFTAKDFFNQKVDTHKTDMGVERGMAGLFGLNWGEFKAGMNETMRSVFQQPFRDPEREAEAERRNRLTNRSQVEEFTDSAAPGVRRTSSHTDWRKHLITGQTAKGGDGASLSDPYKIAKRDASYAQKEGPPAASHTEDEDMKKVLRESEPLTPTRH